MRLRWALLGSVLVSCGDPAPPPPDTPPMEPPQLEGITQAHNDVRAMASATDPLPPLVWSDKLAATAAAWVAMCRDTQAPIGLLDHNPERSTGHPYYVGESVYGKGGSPDLSTPKEAVTAWAAEQTSYDYATNTCNGICGHYTQIVWRATTELGCAIGECQGLTFRTSIVCNYGPGGNQMGQRPY